MMPRKSVIRINKIVEGQRKFTAARNWEKFHTPKNLVMALAGEVGELIEIFQWLSEQESLAIMKNRKSAQQVEHELADIFYYLVRLADILGVDIERAHFKKMKINKKKYPVRLSYNSARKYNELLCNIG